MCVCVCADNPAVFDYNVHFSIIKFLTWLTIYNFDSVFLLRCCGYCGRCRWNCCCWCYFVEIGSTNNHLSLSFNSQKKRKKSRQRNQTKHRTQYTHTLHYIFANDAKSGVSKSTLFFLFNVLPLDECPAMHISILIWNRFKTKSYKNKYTWKKIYINNIKCAHTHTHAASRKHGLCREKQKKNNRYYYFKRKKTLNK